MNKTKIKIFLTFFLLSSIFTYWTSWNEETNFILAKSLVDDRSFFIDPYQLKTGDKLYLNNHYFAPFTRLGISLLSISPYFFLIFFTNNENILKFLISILTSGVFFSLSVLIIYNISIRFFKHKKHRMLLTFSYGLSTLAFQQARFFTCHSAEVFFASLIIYLFFKVLNERTIKNTILYGAFMGIGLLLTPFFAFLFLFLFIAFIIKRYRKEAILFLLITLLVYVPPFIAYLLLNTPSRKNVEPYFFPENFESLVFPLPNLLQLLFFPSKGLFFYYPILAFSFIGFFVARDKKIETFLSLLSLLFILLTFFVISFKQVMWWFGWVSYGPSRVLTILMPFFLIGLMKFINKFGFKIIIPFFLLSIIINILLLQYGEDKISTLSWEEYKYKMEHFQVLSNPLFDHYLPLTLINGPRSILLENLIIDKKISIDFKHPYNPVTPEFIPPGSPIMKKFEVYLFSIPRIGIVVLRLPWLSMFIIGVLLILVWKDEIFRRIKIKNWVLFLLLVLVFLASFIRVRNVAYGDNWCAPQWDENNKRLEESRWIGQNATLYLFSKEDVNKTLRLSVESFKENQTLEICLNGKFIGNYTIQNRKEILQPIKLKEGVNEFMLRAKGDFTHPWLIGVSCDINLVSFKILRANIY
jgi:hypothetical protein